jgi:hypothetical protein
LAEELLNINNIPRHIFIEGAHEFVLQHVVGALGTTFNAVSNPVVMGRNRGIGVTLINQRAATINKRYHLKNSRLKVHALTGCHNEGKWA